MVCRRSDDKPLSKPMMVSVLRQMCVTRPHLVNSHENLIWRESWMAVSISQRVFNITTTQASWLSPTVGLSPYNKCGRNCRRHLFRFCRFGGSPFIFVTEHCIHCSLKLRNVKFLCITCKLIQVLNGHRP